MCLFIDRFVFVYNVMYVLCVWLENEEEEEEVNSLAYSINQQMSTLTLVFVSSLHRSIELI